MYVSLDCISFSDQLKEKEMTIEKEETGGRVMKKKRGYKGTLWDALKQKSKTDDGCD
jgi:hypothetical protein